MGLFDQNKSKPEGIPTSQVLQMRGDGLSNNQVIQTLQRDGFDSNQIFDAMSQADLRGDPTNFSDLGARKQQATQQSQSMPQQQVPQQQSQQESSFPSLNSMMAEQTSQTQVEEIVEAMVDEKWSVFEESIKKVINWKTDVEVRMGKMEQQMTTLNDQLKTLQEGIYGKIGEYDKHIKNIGTELKAVDKVFSKVLPALAENVAELGTIAHQLKKK